MNLRDFLLGVISTHPVRVYDAAHDAWKHGHLKVDKVHEGYGVTRDALNALVAEGKVTYWPEHDCWSIGPKVEMEKGE